MQSVTQRCYARIGLIGNPSDGYGGKTLSAICKNFYAEVTLNESDQLVIEPDNYRFNSVSDLQSHIVSDGYYGASRLFRATINVFAQYVNANQPTKTLDGCFAVRYQTNIPRMVGLSGSSALVVAMLKALMQFYSVEIERKVLPSIALQVEKVELNIGGGLQDRVIQFYEGLVAMDFGCAETVDGYVCGEYQELDVELLPPLYLAYSDAGGEPTEVFHNNLRERYNSGETLVVDAMQKLVALTDESLRALRNQNTSLFSRLMDENFNIRRSISALNPYHIKMVETARSCGVSAKYAGSGGAIIGVCEDDLTFAALERALGKVGCHVVRPLLDSP